MKKRLLPTDRNKQQHTAIAMRVLSLVASVVLVVVASCGFPNGNLPIANAFSFGTNHPTRPKQKPIVGGGFEKNGGKEYCCTTTDSNTDTKLWRIGSRKRSLSKLHQHRNQHRIYELGDDDDCELIDDERSNNNSNSNINSNRKSSNPVGNFLAAAAFVTATVLGQASSTPAAQAATTTTPLDLVSPGTTIIETRTASGDASKILRSTEHTLNSLRDTVLLNSKNRNALRDSFERIRSTIRTEVSSVEAWKEVINILKDYGVDLRAETTVVVRPPSDIKRAFGDATASSSSSSSTTSSKPPKRVTLLVNGEIVQIELGYQKGQNTKQALEDGSPIQPDDEWVLRIRGFKGFDPTLPPIAKNSKEETSSSLWSSSLFRYEPTTNRQQPQWFRRWDAYWHAPLKDTNPFAGLTKTHGDVVLVGGSTAVALSYATSYAYYLDLNETENARALEKKEQAASKKKKKKEAAAAAASKKKKNEKNTKPKKKGWLGGGSKKKQTPKEKTPAPKKPNKDDIAKKKAKKKTNETKQDKPQKKAVETKKKNQEENPAAAETKKDTKSSSSSSEPSEAAVVANESTGSKEPNKEAPNVESTKPVPAGDSPPKEEDNEAIDDDEDDESVKVVIDFDTNGNVVLTAVDNNNTAPSSTAERGGPIALAQSLWFPWMGFFVSSSLDCDDRSPVIKFTQALLFPWAGILFRKEQSTTTSADDTETKTNN